MSAKNITLNAYERRAVAARLRGFKRELRERTQRLEAAIEHSLIRLAFEAEARPGRVVLEEKRVNVLEGRIDAFELGIQMSHRRFKSLLPTFIQERQRTEGVNENMKVTFTYATPKIWMVDRRVSIDHPFAGRLRGEWGENLAADKAIGAVESIARTLRKELKLELGK